MSPGASVLLLNASYEPLKVICWKRAVTLFFLGKVEVVDEYEHDIRSVSIIIKAPSVVRLLRYVKIGRRSPPLSRVNIFARDDFECQYCASIVTAKSATIDHVLPRSQGGQTTWENVVCACGPCNLKKGSRTPREAGMRLRKRPIKPDWLPVLNMRFHGKVPDSWHTFFGESEFDS